MVNVVFNLIKESKGAGPSRGLAVIALFLLRVIIV